MTKEPKSNDPLQTSGSEMVLKSRHENNYFLKKRKKPSTRTNDIYEKLKKMKTEGNFDITGDESFTNNFNDGQWDLLNDQIDSFIIDEQKKFQLLMSFNEGPFRTKLLYRASENDFDVSSFHQSCLQVKNTLTVCSIKNGHIVGGFTPLTWDDKYDKYHTHYKTDNRHESFLFNYTMNEKYPIVKMPSNNAIVACKHLGPTFGGGFDFCIGNHANIKYSSSCNFPVSYQKQDSSGISLPKKLIPTAATLTGSEEDAFLIEEWEVFEVFFSPDARSETGTETETAAKKTAQEQSISSMVNPTKSSSFYDRVKDFLSFS